MTLSTPAHLSLTGKLLHGTTSLTRISCCSQDSHLNTVDDAEVADVLLLLTATDQVSDATAVLMSTPTQPLHR